MIINNLISISFRNLLLQFAFIFLIFIRIVGNFGAIFENLNPFGTEYLTILLITVCCAYYQVILGLIIGGKYQRFYPLLRSDSESIHGAYYRKDRSCARP